MRTIDSISPLTQLCGIIGNPVEHSMSPAMHNRAFDVLGLDYVYVAFRVNEGDVKAALDGMRVLHNFRGLSVTIPHKTAVIEYLDDISEVDAAIGSINTIINNNGKLRGLGSDGPGARQALIEGGIPLGQRSVSIIGTGGASRAIAFDLVHNAGISRLRLCGILKTELETLAANVSDTTSIPVEAVLIDEISLARALQTTDVLINASPVGMHPKMDDTPVPESMLHPDMGVMDIVYNPLETKLLKAAQALGCRTVSGLEMFVNQAVMQFESWTGQTAPKNEMRQTVLNRLTNR
ncbi:MAG: shikimate dehydrogenase [Deltaproteobacteria bacterium]|nr:shikimate dehydrogenase [Deltaproteobacteria bacterium]